MVKNKLEVELEFESNRNIPVSIFKREIETIFKNAGYSAKNVKVKEAK